MRRFCDYPITEQRETVGVSVTVGLEVGVSRVDVRRTVRVGTATNAVIWGVETTSFGSRPLGPVPFRLPPRVGPWRRDRRGSCSWVSAIEGRAQAIKTMSSSVRVYDDLTCPCYRCAWETYQVTLRWNESATEPDPACFLWADHMDER